MIWSPTCPASETTFHEISGETSLWARQARVQYSQPVHLLWSMTMAHWCSPLGPDPEAPAVLMAWVPAATATPTAASLRKSRRLTLSLSILSILVARDAAVEALEPGG